MPKFQQTYSVVLKHEIPTHHRMLHQTLHTQYSSDDHALYFLECFVCVIAPELCNVNFSVTASFIRSSYTDNGRPELASFSILKFPRLNVSNNFWTVSIISTIFTSVFTFLEIKVHNMMKTNFFVIHSWHCTETNIMPQHKRQLWRASRKDQI